MNRTWSGSFCGCVLLVIANIGGLRAQWVQQTLTPLGHLYGVHHLDGQQAIASGAPGRIYETSTGGNAWTEAVIPPPLGTFMGVDTLGGAFMLSASTWVVAGFSTFEISEIIVRTVNAGVTWDMVHLGPDFTGCYDMTFMSATMGLAVGKGGRILRTTDAGVTWTAVPTPTTAWLHSLDMYTPQVGFACGDNCVLGTIDGGQSWTLVDASARTNFRISCGTANVLYATALVDFAFSRGLFRSNDAGATWSQIPTPFTPWRGAVHAIGPDTVLVSGNDALYVTFDGGANWYFYPETAGKHFEDIDFADAMTATAAGTNSTVFHTTAGTGSPTPKAYFSPLPQSVCLGDTLTVINGSPLGSSSAWYVDSVLVSNALDLAYAFSSPGTHTIKLAISDGVHSDSLVDQVNVITALPVQQFTLSVDSPVCEGAIVNAEISGNLQGQQYRFYLDGVPAGPWLTQIGGNNYTATLPPVSVGSIVTVVGMRTSSCDSSFLVMTDTVDVVPLPQGPFILASPAPLICPGDTPMVFLLNTDVDVEYHFDLTQPPHFLSIMGNGDSLRLPLVPWNQYNTFTLVSAEKGACDVFVDSTISILWNQAGASMSFPNVVYANTPVAIQNTSTNADSAYWQFGPGAVPQSTQVISPTVTFTQPGIGIPIELAVNNSTGCPSADTAYINVVQPAPSIPNLVCGADTIRGAYGSPNTVPLDLVVDQNGNYFVTGLHRDSYVGNYYGHGLFLAKYDRDGQLLWEHRVPQQSNFRATAGSALAVDAMGNIYLGGTGKGAVLSIAGLTVDAGASSNFGGFVIKFDPDGNGLWAIEATQGSVGSGRFGVTDVLVGRDGSVYFTLGGTSTGVINYPDGNSSDIPLWHLASIARVTSDGALLSYLSPFVDWSGTATGFLRFDMSVLGYDVPSSPSLQQSCDGTIHLVLTTWGSFYVDGQPVGIANALTKLSITDIQEDLSTTTSFKIPVEISGGLAQHTEIMGHDANHMIVCFGRGEGELFFDGIPSGYQDWRYKNSVLLGWDVNADSTLWRTDVVGLDAVHGLGLAKTDSGYSVFGANNFLEGIAVAHDGTPAMGMTINPFGRSLVIMQIGQNGVLSSLGSYYELSWSYHLGGGVVTDACGDATLLFNVGESIGIEGNVLNDIDELALVRFSFDGSCSPDYCASLDIPGCSVPDTLCVSDEKPLYWLATGPVDTLEVRWRVLSDTSWNVIAEDVPSSEAPLYWSPPDTFAVPVDIVVSVSHVGTSLHDSLILHVLPWMHCSSLALDASLIPDTLCAPTTVVFEWAASGVADSLDLLWVDPGGSVVAQLDSGLNAQTASYTWVVPDTLSAATWIKLVVRDPVWGIEDSVSFLAVPTPEVEIMEQSTYCDGDTLYAALTSSLPVTWFWGTGETTDHIFMSDSVLLQEPTVIVTNAYGCWAADSVLLLMSYCVGIKEEESQAQVFVRPNPADTYVDVVSSNAMTSLEIMDTRGRVLLSMSDLQRTSRVPIDTFAPDVYFVRVTDAHGARGVASFIKR